MIKQIRKKLTLKIGLPPGSLDYVGDSEEAESKIIIRAYNQDEFIEEAVMNPSEIIKFKKDGYVNWIEVTGLQKIDTIIDVGKQFEIHAMLLEDVLNTEHLPKYEEGENYSAIILKAYSPDEQVSFKRNHICLVLMDNTIVQLQDHEPEVLKDKITRIKQSKGRARKLNADYLFYVLIDAFVDTYYLFFSNINEKILHLEERLLKSRHENLMDEIHELKIELNNIRKNLFPLRESINDLIKDDSNRISKSNLVFFNDLKDHINQLVEYYLLYSENIKSLIDLNNSNLNNNINTVMKTLTIIATIFIPLTFLAGIYGMNFEFMPELSWRWAYFAVWGIMVAVAVTLLWFFRKKKWL